MRYIAAIDIGTSACKTAFLDENGQTVASAQRKYEVYYPEPGWAEQDAEDWWVAAASGIQDCLRQSGISANEIAGVGVAGQSWSCIPVSEDGHTLARTPIWMDTRARDICQEIEQCIGIKRIFETAGNPFQAGYQTPKILWFQRARPDIYQRTARFLTSNGFIVMRLTGVPVMDRSQSYGIHCYNFSQGYYDKSLAHGMGISLEKLPPVVDCHKIVGLVTKEAAEQTGLMPGTPVVAGGLDAACGTLGAGVCQGGQTQEQGGQAGGMSICLDTAIAHPKLILSPHVIPGKYLLQGGTVGGGASMKWLTQELGEPEREYCQTHGGSPMALLDELAEQVPPGSDGLVFLPYLAGERSPIWDPEACGVWFGLDFQKTRGHLFRSLMEGVAYALRHNLETAEETGVAVQELYSVGGSANSLLWTQIKSDVTGRTVFVTDSDEATVRGAAILAGVAVGIYAGFDEAVKQLVTVKRRHQPQKSLEGVYGARYEVYRNLYPALKDLMKAASRNRKVEEGVYR